MGEASSRHWQEIYELSVRAHRRSPNRDHTPLTVRQAEALIGELKHEAHAIERAAKATRPLQGARKARMAGQAKGANRA